MLRIAIANNLLDLRQEAEKKLASVGLGAEIAADGNVTLVPVSQAAKDLEKRIDDLITERNAARKAKNFKESDRIRDELKSMGVELDDHKDGTSTLKVAR
jgi:cysteinyl-tRNA synthetase